MQVYVYLTASVGLTVELDSCQLVWYHTQMGHPSQWCLILNLPYSVGSSVKSLSFFANKPVAVTMTGQSEGCS